jgi:Zn-dependent M28 family amino/carboxypeptidase
MKKQITFDLKDNSKTKYAMNVVGIIEGNDPKLKNEFVLLSGHFDHVGVNNGVVFNGADDDGSGTVSVLETARILNENKLNKRSVIALFCTGEEKGLWGSSFAAENSTFIPNTVADINIDMDGREHPDSIYAIGSNKLSTEYYNLIRDVNSKTVKLGLGYKFDDPNDKERFFYRSDHYNFALKGIPIVFFFDDMKADYHKATDDVEKINFEKVLKVVKLSANVALKAANLNHRIVVDKKLE